MKKPALIVSIAALLLIATACGSQSGNSTANSGGEKVIKTAPLGNLTVTLENESGQLKKGDNEFLLTVKDSSGKNVEVSAVSLNLHMPGMGTMAPMNNQATFSTTKTPGVCRAKINVEMAGEWQAQVVYEGPTGKTETSFPIIVK